MLSIGGEKGLGEGGGGGPIAQNIHFLEKI